MLTGETRVLDYLEVAARRLKMFQVKMHVYIAFSTQSVSRL